MKGMQRIVVGTAVLALTTLAGSAQTKQPDFSGAWKEDIAASKALTEKKGGVWRVAGATSGGGVPSDAVVLRPTTVITQSATELVIERRYEEETTERNVYKLDGSESVNASRTSTSKTRTVWKGASLVTSGTTQYDFTSIKATSADGKDISSFKRDYVTTRSLMADGTMQVETRSTQDGEERVSWFVLVRAKSH